MMKEKFQESLSGSLFHWWSEIAEQLPDMFCLVQHALTTKKKKWTKDMNFLQHKTNRLRKQCRNGYHFKDSNT